MFAAAQLILFIAIQAFIGFAWWRFVRGRAPGAAHADGLLCAAILYFAQIIGISLLLGWMGVLTRGPLVILNVLCSARVLASGSPLWKRGVRGDFSPALPPPHILPCPPFPKWGIHPADSLLGQGLIRRFSLVLLILLGVLMTRVLLRGAVMAPSDWDGLKYHLPMSALMMQTHQLALGPVHNPVIDAYPKNIEIWFHWILSFFGHDRWVDLAQVPFLALAMLAAYGTARRLGTGRAASVAGVLLLPFAPVVLAQLTTAYTDVALSALLLAAMALLLMLSANQAFPNNASSRPTPSSPRRRGSRQRREYHWNDWIPASAGMTDSEESAPPSADHTYRWSMPENRSPVVLLSFGCALGLLVGTKFSAVAFAAVLLSAFALVMARTRGWSSLPALALVVFLVLLLGGDTYVRNWRLHGNPLFPYRTAILNVDLPGPWDSAQVYGVAQTRDLHPLTRIVRSWRAVDVIGHSEIFGGFGVMWPFLAVASVLSLAVAIRRRDLPRLAVFALFSVLFLVTPLNYRVRFVIYLLGLGCISFSHVLDRAAAPARAVCLAAALAVAASSTYQLLRKDQTALVQRGVSEVAVRGDACSRAEPPYFRPAYDWVRRHAPAGSTVVVFPSDDVLLPYCLWNPSFSNRVEFADAASPTPLHDVALRRPQTILFLPHGSQAYGRYVAEESGRLRPLLSAGQVTLATAVP